MARIRLFLASCVISASPSASISGGMYTPNRPRRPFLSPYQPPTGLSSDRPHASTEPSGAGFCSSAPPSGIQSPWALSMAWRSSIARLSYLSCVPPTWQMMAGGSLASSMYIVYSEVPGGVLSSHGSALVPLPGIRSSSPSVTLSLGNFEVTVAAPSAGGNACRAVVSIRACPVRREGGWRRHVAKDEGGRPMANNYLLVYHGGAMPE